MQYPSDHPVTQSVKYVCSTVAYQLDGMIRPCHQSSTPRDWYWYSLMEEWSTAHYPLLTIVLKRWGKRKMEIRSPESYGRLWCFITHTGQIIRPVWEFWTSLCWRKDLLLGDTKQKEAEADTESVLERWIKKFMLFNISRNKLDLYTQWDRGHMYS